MTNKYIKNPIEIEAIQWNGNNTEEIKEFVEDSMRDFNYEQNIISIETPEGVMKASLNDYIIKGIKGEFYPCKPDIFENSYTKAPDRLTNYDAIKRMSLEELTNSSMWTQYCSDTRKIGKCADYLSCIECRREWLKRDVSQF